MNTYPLQSITQEQAVELQFKVVDCITHHFSGREILSLGDLGLSSEGEKPSTTVFAEKAIADIFEAEAAVLVQGAGTGAIKWSLFSCVDAGDSVLIHTSPTYPTTLTTLEIMGINRVEADFNDPDNLKKIIKEHGKNLKAALIQHTRQAAGDSYDLAETIGIIRKNAVGIKIIVDDNYAAMKAPKIGCQCGADLSTFSCFKLLGPEGLGVVVGSGECIKKIAALQYSGGSKVQGHEAMAVLRGMVYAPVAFAIQARVCEELAARLNAGEVQGVEKAWVANAQSKVVLVRFSEPIATDILRVCERFGAAVYPVGSESRYEIAPLFYRISGTFRANDPQSEKYILRINPMRSGVGTILGILRQSMERISKKDIR